LDAIRQQFLTLEETWQGVLSAVSSNPALYEPHLKGATPTQINEVVSMLGHWLKRTRAPKGFAPTFHLASGLTATGLAAAVNAAQALARGEYGHFPSFVLALNQMVAGLHSMLLFGDAGEAREAVAALGGRLAEALALVETAQRELASRTSLLESAQAKLSALDDAVERIESVSRAAQEAATAATSHAEAAGKSLAASRQSATESEPLRKEAADLLEKAEDLQVSLTSAQKELAEVTSKSRHQQELIDALLPKGASAGLASAFAGRVAQLERTKWIWASVFAVGIGLLFLVAWQELTALPLHPSTPVWEILLQRLPFAAPAVWIGWFAAIQYGNTLRVQEDYAFKEATSKAFAGYRDHMEHLASVSLKEGNTAMLLMAQKTIEILSHEPLRIFQGTDKDASPGHSVINALFKDKAKSPPPSSS
jgi:hypothetical protein